MARLAELDVVRPTTLADAVAAMATAARQGEPLRPMAGCTDVLVDAHFGKPLPARFLDVGGLRDELGGLRWDAEGLTLGALCTYAQALAQPRFGQELPALARASGLVGATQIQSRGTFAGNVENGSPAADAVPALMALDAAVVLVSERGPRSVPLAAYYTGYRQTVRAPDELIAAITVPAAALGQKGQWFRKVGTRAYQAITKVGVAAQLTWQDGRLVSPRIVAVSMAATICRCRALEAALAGATFEQLDDTALRAAQDLDLQPIGDIRSTAGYRAEIFARLLREALARTRDEAAS